MPAWGRCWFSRFFRTCPRPRFRRPCTRLDACSAARCWPAFGGGEHNCRLDLVGPAKFQLPASWAAENYQPQRNEKANDKVAKQPAFSRRAFRRRILLLRNDQAGQSQQPKCRLKKLAKLPDPFHGALPGCEGTNGSCVLVYTN